MILYPTNLEFLCHNLGIIFNSKFALLVFQSDVDGVRYLFVSNLISASLLVSRGQNVITTFAYSIETVIIGVPDSINKIILTNPLFLGFVDFKSVPFAVYLF